MKSLDRAITRFCHKHPNFGVRNLMLYLVAASGIFYIFVMMDRTGTLVNYIAFNPALILRGQVWRIVTFLLMPTDSNIFFEVVALYFYYFIGSSLERQWGTARFTIYYLTGVLFNAVFGMALYFIIKPDTRVLLFFFIPIKMKWLAIVDAVFFGWSIIRNIGVFPLNLLPLVAILNFFLFCGSDLFGSLRRNRTAYKRRAQWDKAVHQAQREERSQPYRHKCSVCGRTDVTNPELEFRYCSKCQGYHCFCQDHINSHVHFTE